MSVRVVDECVRVVVDVSVLVVDECVRVVVDVRVDDVVTLVPVVVEWVLEVGAGSFRPLSAISAMI